MFNAWIVGLLGIWAIIAAFVPMTATGNAWNDWIVGVVVAIAGFTMSGEHQWQRWTAGVVGVWLFVSGFIPGLRLGAGLVTNNIIVGILLIVAGFAAMRHHHAAMTPPQVAH